jgi:hypothetical protein
VWARNPTTKLSLSQIRWMPWRAWSATSDTVSPVKLASSVPLRLAHRYSTGFSSGVGGQPLDGEPVALCVQMGAHLVAPGRQEPVPQQHHLVAGVETGQLLQHLDEAVGVVAVGLEVEAQPRSGAVGGSRARRPWTRASRRPGGEGSGCGCGVPRSVGPVGSARCPIRGGRQARPILRGPLFDPRPLVLYPVLDRFLLALVGLALGALHGPAQPLAQQPPGRRIRQLHPGQTLDEDGDAVQGPPIGGSITSSCSSAILGGRPVGPRLRNEVGPLACQRACQRLTLWRETSSSPATSTWERPWANSSAARSRRAWRAARCWAPRCRACCLRRLVDMPGMLPHHQPPVTLT